MAKHRGEIYAVTGPVFLGSNLQRIGGAVMAPSRIFKGGLRPKPAGGRRLCGTLPYYDSIAARTPSSRLPKYYSPFKAGQNHMTNFYQ